MLSRRKLLAMPATAAVALRPASAQPVALDEAMPTEVFSLDGLWLFRTDPGKEHWREVRVPHTWQIESDNAEYRGVAWYRRQFDAPASWAERAVRIEFEAVFHTAAVWINGVEAGRHAGKGYTAFTFDLSRLIHFAQRNTIDVRVDNSFDDNMLPRGRSSDWAHDGGIYRPVQLLITPRVFIERVAVQAESATVAATVVVRNTSAVPWSGPLGFSVLDEAGLTVTGRQEYAEVSVPAGEAKLFTIDGAVIKEPKLWSFDHPDLYRLVASLQGLHSFETTFGIRKIETRGGGFYLNGERVRLMGVERMAGSNPEYGMAEPSEWIEHDHADMKELNCVFTRVHWPQDRRVLDWCDRHGILIQTEVPTWGPDTFRGMTAEPSPAIMNNGLEQLREMIERDRNHPCIFSWGVCNEIGGQNPPAYEFARRMYEEAKKLDPARLVSYASNSLEKTPGKDVAGVMDFVMCNEYFGTWNPGTTADLARTLDEIHRAFPDKAVVISEYGYCACTPDRPEGDGRRIETLVSHDRVFREREYIAGLIFFCYNDYRTHIGDRGRGVMKQRVHGVVDLYGARKPSWESLRAESSPIESLAVTAEPGAVSVHLRTRSSVPSYLLTGYELRAIAYGAGNIPVERLAISLPILAPGREFSKKFSISELNPVRVDIDVLRPAGVCVASVTWRPLSGE